MLQRRHFADLLPKMQHFRQQRSKMSTLQHQSLGQGRAGQGRAGQGRAGQGRAEQVARMHEHVTLIKCVVHLGLEGVTNYGAARFSVFSQGRGVHQMRDAHQCPG